MGWERAAPEQRPATEADTGGAVRAATRAPAAAGGRPLEVGAADDPAELEADRIARQVVAALASPATPTSEPTGVDTDADVDTAPVARRPAATGHVPTGPVDTGPAGVVGDEGGRLDDHTTSRIRRARVGGRPMPMTVRRSMESALGASLSHVRLHHGAESARLNDRLGASAFTAGPDIFFRDGLPDTGTDAGRELLAHEVAHTLQADDERTGDCVGRIRRKRRGRRRRRGHGRGGRRRRASRRRRGRAPKGPTVVAPDAESGFTKLAPLLDAAAPTIGDSAEVEASVKVPVGPASFIQLDLSGEVSRDDDGVELGVEIMVGYGGSLPYGLTPEMVGKLSGSVESKGATSAKALTLVSYAYYRQCRESSGLPRELADRLWGTGDGAGYDEAEKWAAQVESDVFADDDEAKVSIGIGGAVEAEWDAEETFGFSAGLGAKVASSTSYSKSTLESSGTGGASQLGRAGKETDWSYLGWAAGTAAGLFSSSWGSSLKQRGAQKSVGEVERSLSMSGELEIGPASGEIEAEFPLAGSGEYEVEIGADLDLAEWDVGALADRIIAVGAELQRVVAFLRANARSMAQYASVLFGAADALAELSGSFAAERAALVEHLGAAERSRKMKLGIEIEGTGTPTTSTVTKCTVSLSQVTEHSFKKNVLGSEIEASYSRERTLLSFDWPAT